MELRNAKEALRLTRESKKERVKEEVSRIAEIISDQIHDGKCDFIYAGDLYAETENELISKGYRVRYLIGNRVEISWEGAEEEEEKLDTETAFKIISSRLKGEEEVSLNEEIFDIP